MSSKINQIDLDETLTENNWEYIGSGAANVVISYKGERKHLKGKVIRLRLKKSEFSTNEIYSYLKSQKFHDLKSYMIPTIINEISQEFLVYIQKYLDQDKIRLQLDLNEKACLIMDNIFSDEMSHYNIYQLNKYLKFFINEKIADIIFEFKPKWISEMPNNHVNCRNCLVAKLKDQKFIPCHLKIFNNLEGLQEWCREIDLKFKEEFHIDRDIFEFLKNCFISNYTIINTLYELQNNFDIHKKILNLTSEADVDEDLQFNITVRDVSIFMNLSKNRVYILDLDKKSPNKWEKWKIQEKELQKYYFAGDLDLNCRIKTNS